MRNLRMQEKLNQAECIDVSGCRKIGPYYVLDEFIEGVDYADAEKEFWIWSIGRAEEDLSFRGESENVTYAVPKGTILASTSSIFYQQEGVTCLWLR